MERTSVDFMIHDAGSLLFVADKNFGGHRIDTFHEFLGGLSGFPQLRHPTQPYDRGIASAQFRRRWLVKVGIP